MTVRQLMTQAVTVQPMGPMTTDAYGNAVQGALGAPVSESGYLDQKDTIEYLNDRDTAVTKWKAFLFPESVVTAFATLTFQGQLFQVDGAPYHVTNPRTRLVSHIECKLTEIT